MSSPTVSSSVSGKCRTCRSADPGDEAPTFFGAYGMWSASPMPTWEDVAWLRSQVGMGEGFNIP